MILRAFMKKSIDILRSRLTSKDVMMVLARFGAAIKPSACPHPILHFVCILKLLE